ncbi:MAG: alpha/beta hydrolase [Frankiaceae bacterium]|nr:alpha/beta hydrolase [Frankiaceae bacterium]
MRDVDSLLRELGGSSLVEMRAGLDALAASVTVTSPVHDVRSTELELPGRTVPIRIYRPAPDDLPRLMWFHGGGYVSGSLDAIDPTCRELALRAQVEVVSVGYRLAPEHRFPAGLDDCLEAAAALRPHAVGGDSAGGGLAAAVAQRVAGLQAQVLLCPWLDGTLTLPSVRANSAPDGLNESALRIFAELYADDPTDPGVSPLHAPQVSQAAPAVIVTAGQDPLCDDGDRYAEKLLAAGVAVHARRWDEQIHGFPGMTAVTPAAAESLQWAADRLRELL